MTHTLPIQALLKTTLIYSHNIPIYGSSCGLLTNNRLITIRMYYFKNTNYEIRVLVEISETSYKFNKQNCLVIQYADTVGKKEADQYQENN